MRARPDGRTGGPAERVPLKTVLLVVSRAIGVSPTAGPPVRRSALSAWLQDALQTLRRIAGMPDYQAYLGHLRLNHPDWPVPSEREFFALYVESRYGNGPSRCC